MDEARDIEEKVGMKPILFNTEMVQAIIEGRKTVTRRLVKPRYRPEEMAWIVVTELHSGKFVRCEYLDEYERMTRYMPQPFYTGDILYVRETFAVMPYGYVYRADGEDPEGWDSSDRWVPSIHMPKEAARLFLRVTDVRVESLQAITPEDCEREAAAIINNPLIYEDAATYKAFCRKEMKRVWDSTIKPSELPTYGWEANPWVWVVNFKKVRDVASINF